jgi:hypothetical protein
MVVRAGLMDTGPDGDLDDLAALAASVAGTLRAFVTLVDARRSYWKAVVEVPTDGPEDGMAEQIDLPCCRTRCDTEDLRPNPCDTPAVSARSAWFEMSPRCLGMSPWGWR